MIQFQPGKFQELIKLISTSRVCLTNLSAIDTQGVLNLLSVSKSVDLLVKSYPEGLVISTDTSSNKVATVDMAEYLVADVPAFTESILYKTDTNTAELRYVPMLHSVLFVKNKGKREYVMHDDEGNIFNVSTEEKTRGVKQTLLPQFFPNLHKHRQEAAERIEKSNIARNVHDLKVGDTVQLRTFANMVEEFGEVDYPIGDGKSIKLTAIIPGFNNIAFLNHASHLTARTFTVTNLLDNQEVMLQDKDGVKSFTTLIDPETLEQNAMEEPIRFSRLHLTKK